MKLAVLDFDSTLINEETLDVVYGNYVNWDEDEMYQYNNKHFTTDTDFFESITERAKCLEGMEYYTFLKVCQEELTLTKGAKELIAGLKNKGYKIVIFSGGFQEATSRFVKELGLDSEFSNQLEVDYEGILTGRVGGSMTYTASKGEMIQKLQNLLDISKEDTIVIGDGLNDLSMFEHAQCSVAFCAKPAVKERANIIIEERDLSLVLEYI